jgi:ABC-type nitrate/sulfonate/bicarbonate transport system substrate-binding protein
MKKVLCVMVVIGFLLVGSLPVAAETYTLGFITNIAFAQYKVAEVKGFWEKQGVTVKFINYDEALDALRGVINRRYDLALLPIPVIATYRNAGVFDAVYLGTFSIPVHGKSLILKKDLFKKSLKGQTIGVFVNEVGNRFFLSNYLKTVNTDLADVRLVQMTINELEANFLNDRLQVVLTIDRGNKFYEKANGLVAISIKESYEPHGLAFIKEGGVSAIPLEDLKKILRGCVDAIQWIRDPANGEEYKAILKQSVFTDMPDLSDDRLQALMKVEKFVDPQTLLEHNQQLLSDYFTQYREFLIADGALKADVLDAFTYDNVIYNQALIEVLQEYVQ